MKFKLDDYLLTTADLAYVANTSPKNIRNWMVRPEPPLKIGKLNLTGRHEFTLLDAYKVSVVDGLIDRCGMGPSSATGAAEIAAREILKRAPLDADGRPQVDVNSIGRTVALAFATIDGELRVEPIDPGLPGYSAFGTDWSHPYIVVPLAGTYSELVWRWMDRAVELAR